MQLQFHKTEISCLQQVKWDVQNQEQTQEIRIGDGMPDIGRVLGAWGQVLLRSKEWYHGSVTVSGGVMVWVLYIPEEGGTPQCVDAWIPFQTKLDIEDADREGTLRVSAVLRNADARSISARKMMLRVSVGVLTEAFSAMEQDIYSPGELPEDVEILKNTYPLLLPAEAGEKPFLIDEELSMQSGANPVKLMRYSLTPEILEKSVMVGKLLFRGTAIVHLLCCGEDGRLYSQDLEVPFSQFGDLEGEYEKDTPVDIMPCVTSLEVELLPDGKLHLKAGATAQYVLYKRPLVEVVEDAYSNKRQVTPVMESLQLPAVLDMESQNLRVEQAGEAEASQIADVAFLMNQPRMVSGENVAETELSGQFQTLYYNNNGEPEMITPHWEQSKVNITDSSGRVTATVMPAGKPAASLNGGTVTMTGQMTVNTVTTATKGIPVVTALELGEATEENPNRPSLILRRAGEERLWDVAKCCNSTVGAIMEANHLQGEPDSEQMLLIPVVF